MGTLTVVTKKTNLEFKQNLIVQRHRAPCEGTVNVRISTELGKIAPFEFALLFDGTLKQTCRLQINFLTEIRVETLK